MQCILQIWQCLRIEFSLKVIFLQILLRKKNNNVDFNPKDKDKDMCMNSLIHAADISNPLKPWEICKVWTEKVLEEFWN